jgi:MFS family permease
VLILGKHTPKRILHDILKLVLQSAVSTALPRIVHDLGGDEFVWVGSAYTLAASAFIPLTGGLAQVKTKAYDFFFEDLQKKL